MGSKNTNDPLKGTEWGTLVGGGLKEAAAETAATATVIKRRPRRRMKEIPEYYFLPRRPMWANLLIYGSCIAGGLGAGMLIEMWMKKKLKEDADAVVWELGKRELTSK